MASLNTLKPLLALFEFDGTIQLFDELLAAGQTKAGVLILSVDHIQPSSLDILESLEQLALVLLGNARARIDDFCLEHVGLGAEQVVASLRRLLLGSIAHFFDGLTREDNGNVSLCLFVVLHGVLYDIEEDEFIQLPVSDDVLLELVLLENSHVDLPLFNLVLEGPQDFQNRLEHVRTAFQIKFHLILLELHALQL
eukprot:CAMPEP_0170504728 /NCGR_PEP_ID=MMETSP0208-20121228/48794_1 /TAXON_ID=197538 /ORGANISM="Strombidium inclinatum, Strain S3" /LENGTH=195 /DNA_ID=CAMNT_0010785153 /DNA_START=333 /DNA_END=916 /DNA_ORIENTATION=+